MITSAHNPRLKQVRRLLTQGGERRERNSLVVEGVRLVEEALDSGWHFQFVLAGESLSGRGRHLLERLQTHGVDVEQVSDALIKTSGETENPQGILAVLEQKQLEMPVAPTFVLIPDQVRDPGNLGTLLRTAAAAGVEAVLLPPGTADPFAPKVMRAGMGAHFRLPIRRLGWQEIPPLLQGMQVILADANGESSPWDVDLTDPLALIVGGEASGAGSAARAAATLLVSIPMEPGVESLNAATAGAILLFEVVRQRRNMIKRSMP